MEEIKIIAHATPRAGVSANPSVNLYMPTALIPIESLLILIYINEKLSLLITLSRLNYWTNFEWRKSTFSILINKFNFGKEL